MEPDRMIDGFNALLTSAAVLAAVVGIILLLGRAARYAASIRPMAAGRTLIVRETIALDARRRLHLIEHGDRSVLLLTGGGTDVVVGWLDRP